jgi:hypothetical protein
MRIRWSHFLLVLLLLALAAFILSMVFLHPSPAIISRYPGYPSDDTIRIPAAACNASDLASWSYSACTSLTRCILDQLDDLQKNDISIGTTILGLLPSIMAVATAQPEDIVKLALISPVRGIATAAFGLGLSQNAFRRLGPVGIVSGDEGLERTWAVGFARVGRGPPSWRQVLFKIAADVFIVGLTSTMLWLSWTVNSAVVVQ